MNLDYEPNCVIIEWAAHDGDLVWSPKFGDLITSNPDRLMYATEG